MQGSEIVLTDEVECFWLSGASADRGPLFPEPRRSPSQVGILRLPSAFVNHRSWLYRSAVAGHSCDSRDMHTALW